MRERKCFASPERKSGIGGGVSSLPILNNAVTGGNSLHGGNLLKKDNYKKR